MNLNELMLDLKSRKTRVEKISNKKLNWKLVSLEDKLFLKQTKELMFLFAMFQMEKYKAISSTLSSIKK